MLVLTLNKQEFFNEQTQEFFTLPEETIHLEHTLVSLSKWESHFEKPFIGDEGLSQEETIYYVQCMSETTLPDSLLKRLDSSHVVEINKYLEKSHTATWFSDRSKKKQNRNSKKITSELIYYWMIALNIPIECETWNLNRLMTLIKVCNIESQPPKKMSRATAAARARELNKARREQLGTSG